MTDTTTYRRFTAADLQTLAALKAHPRPAGWSFSLDHDDTWSLITIQPPAARSVFVLGDPWKPNPCYCVIPAPGGAGVLMTGPDGRTETAYGSLKEALADVGPVGVSWRKEAA